MKFLRHIALLIILAVFMISSAGIFLTVHECKTCAVTKLFINADEPLFHHKETMQVKKDIKDCCSETVCSVPQENGACCSEENFYLKISESYTVVYYTLNFNIHYLPVDIEYYSAANSVNKGDIYNTRICKPPDDTGKDLLHKLSVLII